MTPFRWLPPLLAVVGLAASPPACAAQASGDGLAAFQEGRWEEAIAYFRERARSGEATAREQRLLVRALAELGRYDDAVEAARDAGADSHAAALELANTLGGVLVAVGRLDEAEAAFRQAVDGGAGDRMTAELNLAVLALDRGERDAAMAAFDRFIDYYNDSPRLSASDLSAVATAVRHLGEEDPQLFHDALRAYDEAIAADPNDLEPRILLGDLFLQKYQGVDALETYREVLRVNPRHPRALLGVARTLEFEGNPSAAELARSALEVNPNLVAARAFIARLHMGLENFDDALAEVERALEVNPVSLEALSVLASIHHVRGDAAGFREAEARIFARNPRYADLYTTMAELSVQQRQYHEAVALARRALELDGRSWRAHGVLGINLLRIGEIEEGRASLETAFAGDPFHVWTKNTLDLLDTFENFRTTVTPRFHIVIHERESELLAPYVGALAEEAFDRLVDRYGAAPPTPIRIEMFPSHADFSVRTVGLTGLGALGVSFGAVVAMDSPSARDPGEFNWGSTLWHEIAHSFHLALTDYRVPRWFTEGLAVLEERHARPGWGAGVTPAFLRALRDGQLLHVAELNNGFVRPSFPEQVAVSYYHASLVLEAIEEEHGFRAIAEMMAGYREGRTTDEVFGSVLGTELDAFNDRFMAGLRDRYGHALAALPRAAQAPAGRPLAGDRPELAELQRRVDMDPDNFSARLALGRALVHEERHDEALPHLERARQLFPEYGGHDGPYALLARIHRQRGDLRRAAENLERLVLLDEANLAAVLELADVLEESGELAAAAAALERAVYIDPSPVSLHVRLATLYGHVDRWTDAARARLAVLALDPVDRASALYEIAYAYFRAGDTASARRYVLRALEVAPLYREAQELLLEISSAATRADLAWAPVATMRTFGAPPRHVVHEASLREAA